MTGLAQRWLGLLAGFYLAALALAAFLTDRLGGGVLLGLCAYLMLSLAARPGAR